MTDTRLATALPAHPKTKRLIKRFEPHGEVAAWGLVCLILWTGCNRPDGDLSGMSDEDLELAVDWRGANGSLIQALASLKFLDGDEYSRQFHDWEDHQPWLSSKKTRSANSKWAALVKNHGHDGARDKMPEYYDAHKETCDKAAGRTLKPATRSIPDAPSSKTPCPISVSDTVSNSVSVSSELPPPPPARAREEGSSAEDGGTANLEQPDSKHIPSPAEKKETGGSGSEVWLDAEPAVRWLCPVFGLHADIVQSPDVTGAAVRTWPRGVPRPQLVLIEAFYAAAPAFRNSLSVRGLHPDDPRRFRRWKLDALINNWAEQIAHAENWEQMRSAGTLPKLVELNSAPSVSSPPATKKEPLGVHPLERLPDFDWEAVAKEIAPQMGWSEAEVEHLAELNWRDLAPEHRRAILDRRQQKKRTSHE